MISEEAQLINFNIGIVGKHYKDYAATTIFSSVPAKSECTNWTPADAAAGEWGACPHHTRRQRFR